MEELILKYIMIKLKNWRERLNYSLKKMII